MRKTHNLSSHHHRRGNPICRRSPRPLRARPACDLRRGRALTVEEDLRSLMVGCMRFFSFSFFFFEQANGAFTFLLIVRVIQRVFPEMINGHLSLRSPFLSAPENVPNYAALQTGPLVMSQRERTPFQS